MSQRNYKTTQRKTRGLQSNFAARPIGATLTSIKESVGSVSTGSHSLQSGNSIKEKGESHTDQSGESPNNIFQIIEEECYNEQLKQQHDKGEVNTKSPPEQAFNHDGQLDDQVHYIENQNGINIQETKTYDVEEDDDAPIIYAHHDDDSISQITSSIAGNSMYSSDYMLSKLSLPDQSMKQKYKAGVAVARNQHWNMSVPNRKSDDADKNTPLMGDEELDKFFGPSSSDNNSNEENKESSLKTGNISLQRNSSHEERPDGLIDVNIYTTDETGFNHKQDGDEDDDFTIRDMYSAGSSIGGGAKRSFVSSPQRTSTLGNFLQKMRLKTTSAFVQVKVTINKLLPLSNSSNMQQKKDDDHEVNSTADDVDYFNLLMNNNFGAPAPRSPSQQRNKKEGQVNLVWVSCLLIMTWFLLYLAKIGNDSVWEKNRNKGNGKMIRMQKTNVETVVNEQVHDVLPNNVIPVSRPGVPYHNNIPANNNMMNSNINPNNAGDQQLTPGVQPLPQGNVQNLANPMSGVQTLPQNNMQNIANPASGAQPIPQNNIPLTMNSIGRADIDTSHIGMPLPENFNNFLDVGVKAKPKQYLPFFWHVPRTAGATINEILGVCYHLRMASNAGTLQGHSQDQALQLLDVGEGHTYVNVDVSNSQGIQRAVSLGLVSSGLSDVVVSPLVNESGQLFDPKKQGKMFTMLRHPVERAVSLFRFLQDVYWKAPNTYNEELANIDIMVFFKNRMGETNWQVRYLTNQLTKPFVDESDLKLAKEILRRKCLIGLTTDREESFERFQKHFGWKLKKKKDRECLKSKLQWDWSLQHPHEPVEQGTDLWNIIASTNQYDMQLYEYARVLFAEQSAL